MGIGYYKPLTTWSKGEYANSNSRQVGGGKRSQHVVFLVLVMLGLQTGSGSKQGWQAAGSLLHGHCGDLAARTTRLLLHESLPGHKRSFLPLHAAPAGTAMLPQCQGPGCACCCTCTC